MNTTISHITKQTFAIAVLGLLSMMGMSTTWANGHHGTASTTKPSSTAKPSSKLNVAEVKPDPVQQQASKLLQQYGHQVRTIYVKPEDAKVLVAATKKNGIRHVVELTVPSLKVIRIQKEVDAPATERDK